MTSMRAILFLIIIVIFNACSKDEFKKSIVKEKSLDLQVQEAYKEGMEALEEMMSYMQLKNLMKLKHCFHNLNGPQSRL